MKIDQLRTYLFRISMVVLMIAIPLSVMAGTAKKIIPGKTETRMMVINGDNAWLNTGFVVKPTDRITIKASGQIRFSNGESHSETSPDGYRRQAYEEDFLLEDAAHCLDPLLSDPHAALIGKDKQGLFVIGRNTVLTGKTGVLFIGINDCSFKGTFYNTGKFQVTITVVRGK